MSIFAKCSVAALTLAAALAVPAMGEETSVASLANQKLTLTPSANAAQDSKTSDAADQTIKPQYLDAAPEAPNIHGFFNTPFKTAYVTPRGLVVQNAGVVWQPVVGLVFPLEDLGVFKKVAFVGGIWNSVDSAEASANGTRSGPWDEMDVFASFNSTVADNFDLSLTYGAWNFPQSGGPETEHNLDLKVTYDDSKMWGSSGWALHPYADFFWAISGGSTVVLGRHGSTGYIELGVVPTYTCKAITDYPLTFTFPTYFSVGPRNYWDEHGAITNSHLGVFSASADVSMPLSFIPTKYGFWHADAGVTYDYLMNDALLAAGGILSGNDNHNVLIASLGFGVNF